VRREKGNQHPLDEKDELEVLEYQKLLASACGEADRPARPNVQVRAF
jgi:hypothetical protein